MTRRLSSLIAALLLAGAAEASPLWPPVRYQGDATVTVHWLAANEVTSICDIVSDRWADACTIGGELYLPKKKGQPDVTRTEAFVGAANPCRGRSYDQGLGCHELGHHNGWAADHPQ